MLLIACFWVVGVAACGPGQWRRLGWNIGEDGEGRARICKPGFVAAGVPTPIEIEFTTGPSGIAVGGGFCIGLHHGSDWHPLFQSSDPAKPSYVCIDNERQKHFEVTCHARFPLKHLADKREWLWGDGIYHKAVMVRVKDRPLLPGERVRLSWGAGPGGAAIHRMAHNRHEFRVMTDIDGDGVFKGIRRSPVLDIIPGPSHHLVAVVPSQVTVGKPFDMQIRVEDAYFNCLFDPKKRDLGYHGRISVSDEDGRIIAKDIGLREGRTVIHLSVADPGPRRFRLNDGRLTGRSNPCKAFRSEPEVKTYWGDIHGHTGVSDGLGYSAADYFKYGRDIARLDVCALTDHGYFAWPQNQEAVRRFYTPGKYVTLLALEAGAGPDHMNCYFRNDDAPPVGVWPDNYYDLLENFCHQYNTGQAPQAIVGPHHFSYPRGNPLYPFGIWNYNAVRFVEVYSNHGTSEYLGNPRPVSKTAPISKFMQWGLAKGLQFGVIASSDCHDSHPGRSIQHRYPGGLTAFRSPELTREAIWKAFWNRQVYATSFDRIYLEFSINQAEFGSEIHTDEPVEIAYEVIGKDDELQVYLIRNNRNLRIDRTVNGMIRVRMVDEPFEAYNFYYLRVVQQNGERAWSTPIWVVRSH